MCLALFISFFASDVSVAFGVSAFGAGFEDSSVFLVSAVAACFSVVAGVAATSVFSVAGAGVSEVAAELDRSTFGAGVPSP